MRTWRLINQQDKTTSDLVIESGALEIENEFESGMTVEDIMSGNVVHSILMGLKSAYQISRGREEQNT